MPNNTIADISSGYTQSIYLRRKGVRRKGKNFRRRVKPHILNRPTSSCPVKFSKLQLKHSHYIEGLVEPIDCSQEMRWIAEHRSEYAGQWVALEGGRLIGNGETAREVYEAAHESGVELPLIVRIEPIDQLPFGGW